MRLKMILLFSLLSIVAQAHESLPLVEVDQVSAENQNIDVSDYRFVSVENNLNSQVIELRSTDNFSGVQCARAVSLGNLTADMRVTYKENEGAWFNSNALIRENGTRRSQATVTAIYDLPTHCSANTDLSGLTPSRIRIRSQW